MDVSDTRLHPHADDGSDGQPAGYSHVAAMGRSGRRGAFHAVLSVGLRQDLPNRDPDPGFDPEAVEDDQVDLQRVNRPSPS